MAEIEKTVSTRLGGAGRRRSSRSAAGRWTGWASIVRCAGPWIAAGLATLGAARPLLDRVDRVDRAG